MEAQQELFTALLTQIKTKYEGTGVGVYDTFLPSEDVPYPFIYLADSQVVDDYGNKSMILGTVSQTIKVWHDNPRKRGTFSAILTEIKTLARSITHTDNYVFRVSNIDQRILTDDSTGTPLMYGILDIDFKIMGGKT